MTQRRTAGLALLTGAVVLPGCVVVGRSDSSSGGSAFGLLFLLIPVLFFVAMFRLVRPRRRRSRQITDDAATTPSSTMLRAELSVLADDVLRLEPQVALKPEARDDYEAALHRYRVAQAALEDAGASVDLVRVQRVVDEASWSMARARAILDGRPLPPPPAPLQHRGSRGEPAVTVDHDQPRYVESPASFRSGWFAFGPGLFGGLLLGSMLDDSAWFGADGGNDGHGGDPGDYGGGSGDYGGDSGDYGGDFGGGSDFG